MSRFALDNWGALPVGLPLVVGLLVWQAFVLRRRGATPVQLAVSLGLRSVALGLLLLLLARPVRIESPEEMLRRNEVALLVDRSESMSLRDGSSTRYAQAVDFARRQLAPRLNRAALRVRPYLFAESAEPASGEQIAGAAPNGTATNLARAIGTALSDVAPPPRAIFALTDGATNLTGDNQRAMAGLIGNGVPLIAVGFGDDTGAETVALESLDAPSDAAPRQMFHVAARLTATGGADYPSFELVLLRDGQFVQSKTVPAGKGPRQWLEGFVVDEERVGLRTYTVRLLPPPTRGVRFTSTEASAGVRISDEEGLRILYVQGGLTWDYKFVRLALQGDPTIQLSSLSRTASSSVFFQSTDSESDRQAGFPAQLEELSRYRVVVLSNLRPLDLTPRQQELLAQFASQLGGGVLMIGGPETFNASWKGSRLEELLPVEFSARAAPGGVAFRPVLTDAARRHPVFQIAAGAQNRAAWNSLPQFRSFAMVDRVKPGAQVWLTRPGEEDRDEGTLMAAQRYGAGTTAVLGVQELWRWRLARQTDTRQVDRFWRQLMRFLAEGGRESIEVRFDDQLIMPGVEIEVSVRRRPTASGEQAQRRYEVEVLDGERATVSRQRVTLAPGEDVKVRFRPERAGLYSIRVTGADNVMTLRSLEIKDFDRELAATARNMEVLRQWASVSGGVALRSEECEDSDHLAEVIQQIEEARMRSRPRRTPWGVRPWMLVVTLGLLAGEWGLRKRWGWT